jgi:flagellar motor switch protein FliM
MTIKDCEDAIDLYNQLDKYTKAATNNTNKASAIYIAVKTGEGEDTVNVAIPFYYVQDILEAKINDLKQALNALGITLL